MRGVGVVGRIVGQVRLFASLGAAVLVAGCSTSTYQKQVSDLSTAFANVQASFDSLSQSEVQAFVAAQTALALKNGNQILIPEECSEVRQGPKVPPTNCIPVIYIGATKRTRTLVYKSAAPNASKLAAAVASYGTSLAALAQAQDVSDLNTAVGKSEAAITKLASDANVPAQPLGAVAGFVGWAVGEYLNELRLQQLRKAVTAADPIVASAASLLAADAAILKRSIVVQKSALLQREQTQLFDMRSRPSSDETAVSAAATTLVADATALQTVVGTDVTQPFLSMQKAHSSLLAALENPTISPDFVFSQIGDFVEQASKLKSGLENSAAKK
jgi:hypothetical protein